jgi:hypothetical protein
LTGRLSLFLYRGKVHASGSHTGFVGNKQEQKPGAMGLGGQTWDGNEYYAARYWQPKEYLDWQNATWHPGSTGEVDVGALEPVRDRDGHDSGNAKPDAQDPQQH